MRFLRETVFVSTTSLLRGDGEVMEREEGTGVGGSDCLQYRMYTLGRYYTASGETKQGRHNDDSTSD